MEVVIRNMTEYDWEDVARIYKEGIETNKATFQTCIPSYEQWDQSHISNCRYIAIYDNKVIGWIALSNVSSRCVYAGVAEVSIYIDADYQNKEVGTKLLQHMIVQSEAHGIWMLQSGIMQDNEASIRLHKKCGFREVGYREMIGKDKDGKWRNTVLMEKRSSLEKYMNI